MPWLISRSRTFGGVLPEEVSGMLLEDDGTPICKLFAWKGEEELDANLRLLAVARETAVERDQLLAALEAVEPFLGDFCNTHAGQGNPALQEVYRDARYAIARARGRT